VAVIAGGQHQDRQPRRVGAQQTAYLQAVEARQHQVEDHQVRRVQACAFTDMVAAAEHADVVAIAFQVAGNQLGECGVVFHQEDVGHGVSK